MRLPLLLAVDFGTILTLVVFILAGLGQLLGNREAPKPKKPRRVPQPPAGGGAGPQPAGAIGAEEKVRREVEEFLRRAQNKPPQPERAKQRDRTQRDRPQRESRQPQREAPPRRLATEPSRSTGPVRLEPIEPTMAERETFSRGESVAEHVAEHIDTKRQVTARLSHLGEEVGLADERLEEHLRSKFEHKLGTLERQAEAVKKDAGPTIAEEVITMLSQPQGMRTLIVANEILKRPEERW